jgi:hypothetical protein
METDSSTSSPYSRNGLKSSNPVRRVNHINTHGSYHTAFKVPEVTKRRVSMDMMDMILQGFATDEQAVIDSYKEQNTALNTMIIELKTVQDSLKKHRADEEDQRRASREVFIFDGVMDVYTDQVELLRQVYHSRNDVQCDCMGNGMHKKPVFYTETQHDQILEFTFQDYYLFPIVGETETNKFKGRFVCETTFSNFSHNPRLARTTLLGVHSRTSLRGQEILAKKKPPLVNENGLKWFLAITNNNSFALQQVPAEYDSIKSSDVATDKWAKRNSHAVIDYKLTDSALSMVASLMLAQKWLSSPLECQALASTEEHVLQATEEFLEQHRDHPSVTLTEASLSLDLSLELYNCQGPLIYKKNWYRAKVGTPVLPIIKAPNGKYYPLKMSNPQIEYHDTDHSLIFEQWQKERACAREQEEEEQKRAQGG